jgi:PST family polysaccharide transporter
MNTVLTISHPRVVVAKLRSCKLARDAFWLLVTNVFSKGLMLLGSAYAARCLGPFNFGVSGLVQATVQQVALTSNGGFDLVAVRRIAHDKSSAGKNASAIVCTRVVIVAIAALVWTCATPFLASPRNRFAWLMGVPILLGTAFSLVFVFQGLERLPIQSWIGVIVSLLSAAAYFLFFRPGMFLGADLIVIAVGAIITTVVSWWAFYRVIGHLPLAVPSAGFLRTLFAESWRFWILTSVVSLYSIIQVPLITYLLGAREAGIFRSAFILAAGMEIIFNSVNNLLLPRLVAWKTQGLTHMWRQQGSLLQAFTIVGVPGVGLVILLAPWIYRTFFGVAYLEGIAVFQILAIGRLVVFVGQIYAWGLPAANLDSTFVIISATGAALSVTLNCFLARPYGIIAVAIVSVTVEFLVHYSCFALLRHRISNQNESWPEQAAEQYLDITTTP